MGEEAFARSFHPEGVARQTMAIAASPDRTWDLRRVRVPTLVVHGLVDPLVTPERRHRHGAGDPRRQARHVPGHGPRPARDRDGTTSSTRSPTTPGAPARTGRRATAPRWADLGGRPPHARRARRRGRARCRRSGSPWPSAPGIAELRRTTRDEPDYDVLMRRPARPARPPRADDERDHRDHRRAGAAAGRGRVPGRAAGDDAGRAAVGHVRRVRPAADGPARLADDPVPQPGGRRRPHRRLPAADRRPEAPGRRRRSRRSATASSPAATRTTTCRCCSPPTPGSCSTPRTTCRAEFPQLPAFDTYDELAAAIAAAA